jgi:hypothetical protein
MWLHGKAMVVSVRSIDPLGPGRTVQLIRVYHRPEGTVNDPGGP